MAPDQLDIAVQRQEYAEAAHLLEAVQQLSSHFQSFAQIPKVSPHPAGMALPTALVLDLCGRVCAPFAALEIVVTRTIVVWQGHPHLCQRSPRAPQCQTRLNLYINPSHPQPPPPPPPCSLFLHCQVAELGGRLSTLQKSLQLNCAREFELLGTGEDAPSPVLVERLRACCRFLYRSANCFYFVFKSVVNFTVLYLIRRVNA